MRESPRTLEALEQLFVQQGRWLDCLELFERRAMLVDNEQARHAILLNLAALAHEKLGHDERAIGAYERIIAVHARSIGALVLHLMTVSARSMTSAACASRPCGR